MQVLIVKTSSLGDVVHTLAAVTDAARMIPGIRFDWVVEEAFAEVPRWHPSVDRVIPIAIRRWRHAPWQAVRSGEWRQFRRLLRARQYDAVIDAQGLVKSALVTWQARGPRYGLDRAGAREPLASLGYQHRLQVPKGGHAITRLRQLFAKALVYPELKGRADFGIDRSRLPLPLSDGPFLVFLQGTTWASKHWPEPYWVELARLAAAHGFQVWLPWGSTAELHRAERIAATNTNARVLERMTLTEVGGVLAGAAGVVGVDTGLAHLGAALEVPGVTLYGPTTPGLTGASGSRQRNLSAHFPCAPCLQRQCRYLGPSDVEPACYQTLPPERVLAELKAIMAQTPDPLR